MAVPAGVEDIPPFTAWPLTSVDDATVFVHDFARKDLARQMPFLGLPPAARGQDYNALQACLLSNVDASETPPYSQVGAVAVRRVGHDDQQMGRGLACLAARRQSVSVTLRSVTSQISSAAVDPSWAGPKWFHPRYLQCNFHPSHNRRPGNRPCWFTLREQCDVLFDCVFSSVSHVRSVPAHGLVVLAGATNSAKTKIAQGLIAQYLSALAAKPRRPHLVTFEDPIETFYVGPRKPDEIDTTGSRQRPSGLRTAKALCDFLRRLPPSLLAQWYGLDYTPRERGKDVESLPAAFRDALRQTPSVFYVGEVREPRNWVDVLEFAGTGHLVVTTTHAGSLVEAMVKILSSVNAQTPSERRRYASRIRAVVHLRPQRAESGRTSDPHVRDLLLPAVWRQSERGLAALSANGFGAIVPEFPRNEAGISSLGRRWFLDRLLERVGGNYAARAAVWQDLDERSASKIEKSLQEAASRADLRGQ